MSDRSGSGLPPAGWYTDPEQAGKQRYWDGTRWTDDRRDDPSSMPPPPGASWSGGGSSGGFGSTGGSYGTGGSFGSGYGVPGTKPDPWLWQSIAATLLCCLPLGIVGIVFASQSMSAWSQGDAATAAAKAKQARTWTLVSVGLGIVAILLFIVAVMMGVPITSETSGF